MPKIKKRKGMIGPSKWRELINTLNADKDIDDPKTPMALVRSLTISLSLPAQKLTNLIRAGILEFEALKELIQTRTQEHFRREEKERDSFLKDLIAAELIKDQKNQARAIQQSQDHTTRVLSAQVEEQKQLANLKNDAANLISEINTLKKQITQLQHGLVQAKNNMNTAQTAVTQVHHAKKNNLINILSGKSNFTTMNGTSKKGPVIVYDQHGKPMAHEKVISVLNNIPEPPPMIEQFKINPVRKQRLVDSEDRGKNLIVDVSFGNVLQELLSVTRLIETGPDAIAKASEVSSWIHCNDEMCYIVKQNNAQSFSNEVNALGKFINEYRDYEKKEAGLEQIQQLLAAKETSYHFVLDKISELENRQAFRPGNH